MICNLTVAFVVTMDIKTIVISLFVDRMLLAMTIKTKEDEVSFADVAGGNQDNC